MCYTKAICLPTEKKLPGGFYDDFFHNAFPGNRRSTNYNMPAVITEHCFLDNENDRKFLAQPDSYQKLAHADATALAQYLHLQSTALGVNYSGYARPVIQTPPAGVPVLINPIP